MQENEANRATVDTIKPESKHSGGVREWLARRRVPHRETDSLLDAVSKFRGQVADTLDGRYQYLVAATATGKQAGRVHVSLHLTWSGLQLGEEQHDVLMRTFGQEFTSRVSHLREPHVQAHLMFVPASSYETGEFENFVQNYAEKESLAYCGLLIKP